MLGLLDLGSLDRDPRPKRASPERAANGAGAAKRAPRDEKAGWVANTRFEISKFKFKFPRARTYEMIGLVLGCIEANFCK